MDEDKAISLEDLDDELEEYTFDMNGGAEPEISDNSINLATNSSEMESESASESESQNKTPETQVASEPEPEPETNNKVEVEQKEPVVETDGLVEYEEEERSEFILDDDDFEMVEGSEDIMIKEETVLPDYQVILGDDEQETDIFNELVKLLPERLRENAIELKKIQRKLDHYINLKVDHGITDSYNNIVAPKFLTNTFRPLKSKFLDHGNFNDSLFVPIVSSKKLIYNVETLDRDGNLPYAIDESDIGSHNVLMRNYTKIKEQTGIAQKYRKTEARKNYSYKNHIDEIFMSMEDAEYTSKSAPGFFTEFVYDTEVYTNLFNDEEFLYYNHDVFKKGSFENKMIMGELGTNFEPPIKGVSANITGFLRKPGGLFVHNRYPMKPLSETIIDYSHENLSGMFPLEVDKVEHVDLDIDIGSQVKLCFVKEQVETMGTIKSMDDEKIIVNVKDEDNELELSKDDDNVVVKNVVSNRNCFNKEMTVVKFPERNLNTGAFSEILDDILPSQNEIVYGLKQDIIDREDEVVNYHEINELLSNYNLSYDHLTSDLRKVLGEIIENNNKKLVSVSRNNKMEYQRFLKSTIDNDKSRKSEKIELLNRKLLEEFKDYYGEYPYYNSSIDSVKERFKWLVSRKDQGTLLFKSVVLKVYNIIYKSADATSDKLKQDYYDLKQKLDDLDSEIEMRKDRIIQDSSQELCPGKRIVKIYHSTADMENDNNIEVTADDNLKTKLSGDNKVKPGDLCVLKENGESKMFVRSSVGESEMWILDESKNIDELVKDNMDYCNLQGKLLEELDNSIYRDSSRCKYSEDLDACVDIELHQMITRHNYLSEKAEEKSRILLIIKDSNSILDRLEKMVVELKRVLKLTEKLNKKIYIQRQEEAQEIEEQEVDREHQDLYNKIDRYLTKINTLPDEKMYPLLMTLVNKYGREADLAEGENSKNVYCIAGSKVLTCKHHVHMAKYFENPRESEGVLNFVRDNFCVDGGDKFYCVNCGQEVYIADFETVEGFQSTGAYQNTTEVMEPDEEQEMEKRVNDTVASINAYLEADKDNSPDLDIMIKLFSVFQNTMGLKVTVDDEKLIIALTLEMNRESIKDKVEWLSGQDPRKIPRDQNKVDMVYKNYQNRSIILNFTGVFFSVVQSAKKPYKITKSHQKCNVSLRGMPLERRGTQGIDYMTCILEGLRDTNSGIFKFIPKRFPIANEIKKIVTRLSNDQSMVSRFYFANLNREDTEVDDTVNNWIQFRPPLNKINVALENTDISELGIEDKDEIKELMLLLSLKGMENINNKIDESEVDNLLYDPVPLDNTCCKVQITENFDYNQFFDNELTKINNSVKNLERDLAQRKKMESKINIEVVNTRDKIPRFDKDIVPDDLNNLDVGDINVQYITSGHNIGERHQYDENGICQLSGESRIELQKQKMDAQRLSEYTTNLNRKKLFKPLQSVDLLSNREVLGLLRKDNKMIQENEYMNMFIDRLNEIMTEDSNAQDRFSNLKLLYDSLEEQIISEVDELVTFISERDRSFKDYNDFLKSLGNFEELAEEMTEKLGEEASKERMSNNKEKYLKRLFKQLKTVLNKISYGTVTEAEKIKKDIPSRWKITDSYKENLVFNVDKSQQIVLEFKNKIDKLLTGENIFRAMADKVQGMTLKLDTLTGRPNILDCDGEITYYSELTSQVSSQILHYLFILLLNNITSKTLTVDTDKLVKGAKGRISFKEEEPETLNSDESAETLEEVNAAAENSNSTGDSASAGDVDEFSIEMDESIKQHDTLVVSFVTEFLKSVKRDYDLINKHTDKFINKTIAKKSDEEKEQNLKFIEDLDKETRASFKVMLMTGLDSWKHLAAKDKSLYFAEDIAEDNAVPQNNDEIDRASAATQLGIPEDELTEERFEEWKNLRDRTLDESNQAFMDREILPDDDGDYDNEHEGY